MKSEEVKDGIFSYLLFTGRFIISGFSLKIFIWVIGDI